MDSADLVSNLKKIDTLLVDTQGYESWVAPTLQEVIDNIEQRERDLLSKYAIPPGWSGTVLKNL